MVKFAPVPFLKPLLIFFLLAGFGIASGQNAPAPKEVMQDRIGPSWKAVSPLRIFGKGQWDVLPNADLHAEYGLDKLITRQYSDGSRTRTVELFEMKFTSGAYGLFTFNRGSLPSDRTEFQVGKFLVSIAGEKPDQAVIDELKRRLENDSGPLPFLPSNLPAKDKIEGSERYLIGPVALGLIDQFAHLRDFVDFTGGVQIATAAYRQGDGRMDVIIVEYNTPQSATDGVDRAMKHYNALPEAEKQSRLVKRTGNYLIEVAGISNRESAEQLVGTVKYAPRVTWEGTKISDIPWEFRPPDPTALEEASETAMMLIRTFYWIGILVTGSILIGIIAGGSFFYYRRYRRRKLGLDDIFSDPGETVRLNLDELLIDSGAENVKHLGSGKEK